MQFNLTLRNARLDQISTTVGAGGTIVFYTGAAPGVGNGVTGTLLSTLTALSFAGASGGTKTFSATADASAAATGTPGYGRLKTSGGTAVIEGSAGIGTAAVLGTVTLSATAIATVPVTSGGTGYPVSASLPVTLSGVVPTIPAIIIANTNSSGVIISTTITYAGTGYGSAPTATVAPPFEFLFGTAISLNGNVSLTSATFTEGNA